MSFTYNKPTIDFGTTAIENIFIHDFMPMANGTHVKIYLTAYLYSQDPHLSKTVDNHQLARHLNLSIEDVVAAWLYWEDRGVITRTDLNAEDPNQFNVVFNCLRQLYLDNNYQPIGQVKPSLGKVSTKTDKLVSALDNPILNTMFKHIDEMILRQLTPNECNEILDWIFNYKMDPDMIERAFELACHDKKTRRLNYVQGILRKWYDMGIRNEQSLESHLETQNQTFFFYKKIYKTIGYGNKPVSAGDKEIMDKWMAQYAFEETFLLYALKEATKRTSNVNMNYLDVIVGELHTQGVTTIEAFDKRYEDKSKERATAKNSPTAKPANNRFHNFQQDMSKLTEDELEQIIQRKEKKRNALKTLTGRD
jgi:DnaD/phage-associated family protein